MRKSLSDVKAKQAFCNELVNNRGFESATIVASPADIRAVKDGQEWFFEIKMTHRTDICFGAATQTEWAQAFADPDHFRFVVVQADETDTNFQFLEFTPAEMMVGSTIPPFKVYFNIDLVERKVKKSKRIAPSTKTLTKERFTKLHEAFSDL